VSGNIQWVQTTTQPVYDTDTGSSSSDDSSDDSSSSSSTSSSSSNESNDDIVIVSIFLQINFRFQNQWDIIHGVGERDLMETRIRI